MKLNSLYLPLTALIYSSYTLATPLLEEEQLFELAKRLSLEENDALAVAEHAFLNPDIRHDELDENEALELAKQLSLTEHDESLSSTTKLPLNLMEKKNVTGTEDEHLNKALRLSREETEEAILLEESYFNAMKKENVIHKKPNDKLKNEIVNDITANDIALLDNLFKKINKTYNDHLKNIERLFFENDTLLHYLDNIFVYDEPEVVLAERANITVEALRNLKKRAHARLEQIKILAKEQGILAPNEQKEYMIVEFMKEKKCSRTFAEKTYKQFVGED